MHERPADIDDGDLATVLVREWHLEVAELAHLPVGFGGHHWLAADPGGSRWFVTVSEVDAVSFAELTATMETAAWLASQAGLSFVVAPVPTAAGPTVIRLAPGYAVTVFRYADGIPGSFGDHLAGADRAAVTDLLATLHGVPPPNGAAGAAGRLTVPVRPLVPASRSAIDLALHDLGLVWRGGAFSEPARRLVTDQAERLRTALLRFDELADRVAKAGQPLVVTHGEPHPGNLLRRGRNWLLVDWDTVGLAVPERDLWWVLGADGRQAARYAARTGRHVSQDAIELYRLRWSLDDIGLFLAEMRAPHRRTADTEVSWAGLHTTLTALPAE